MMRAARKLNESPKSLPINRHRPRMMTVKKTRPRGEIRNLLFLPILTPFPVFEVPEDQEHDDQNRQDSGQPHPGPGLLHHQEHVQQAVGHDYHPDDDDHRNPGESYLHQSPPFGKKFEIGIARVSLSFRLKDMEGVDEPTQLRKNDFDFRWEPEIWG